MPLSTTPPFGLGQDLEVSVGFEEVIMLQMELRQGIACEKAQDKNNQPGMARQVVQIIITH
jgi:hypothetical protein